MKEIILLKDGELALKGPGVLKEYYKNGYLKFETAVYFSR